MDENLKQRYQVYPKVVEVLARVVHVVPERVQIQAIIKETSLL